MRLLLVVLVVLVVVLVPHGVLDVVALLKIRPDDSSFVELLFSMFDMQTRYERSFGLFANTQPARPSLAR